jgi:hypothetical protein
MGGLGNKGKKKTVKKGYKSAHFFAKVRQKCAKARTSLQKVCRNLTFLYFNIMLNCAG